MYSLFVFNKGYYIPVLHVLLQDKKEKTYKRALNNIVELCNKCGINIKENIDSVMIDFELAMVKAVKSVFRRSHIKGCKFHLGQSWWRKIKELGLSPIYRNMKSAHGKWLRGLFGLSLLPPSAVPNVFLEYSSSRFLRQPTEQIKKMVQYLKTYYCTICASFKPEMWAGLDAIGKSTNNGAESFHRHLGDLFGYLRCKPSLPHFLRNMAKYNAYKDMKLISFKPSSVNCKINQNWNLSTKENIFIRQDSHVLCWFQLDILFETLSSYAHFYIPVVCCFTCAKFLYFCSTKFITTLLKTANYHWFFTRDNWFVMSITLFDYYPTGTYIMI